MTTIHTRQLTTIHTRHLKIQHVQKVNNTKVVNNTINVTSIPHLPEHQTTLHIRWSQFTLFSLTLCVCVTKRWPCIFIGWIMGGGGMADISINRTGAVQLSGHVILCCVVMVDLPSVLIYTYTTLPKEPVFMPLICVFCCRLICCCWKGEYTTPPSC